MFCSMKTPRIQDVLVERNVRYYILIFYNGKHLKVDGFWCHIAQFKETLFVVICMEFRLGKLALSKLS